MAISNFALSSYFWILFPSLDATQFIYNTDFSASCYSRIGGFSGPQIDYDSYTLSTTLFDGLAIAGDITIAGNDYFFLQIDFIQPIDLYSAQLIWRPLSARAADTDADSMIFTQITYHNLLTDTFDILNVSQDQWDPIVADYVLFKADTNALDLIFTNSIIFQLTFTDASISDIHLTLLTVAGSYYTWSPSNSPSNIPTTSPTYIPTSYPSQIPSATPTATPSTHPTQYPTQTPTFTVHNHATDRNNNISFTKYSTNIYPLSYRNETLFNFTVPGDKAYCLTCILSWADIDASIQVNGCNDAVPNTDIIPNPFYDCDNGLWTLTTTARLVDWQQTYGRIEIWEVDANDIEYLRYRFEFQWNTSQCLWFNDTSSEMKECNYLPLTNMNEHSAMFEFTMPKYYGDNRNAPLIVVWYDLLSIPYAVRPSLYYQYHNLSLIDVGKGQELGISDLWNNFQSAIIGAGVLIASFIVIAVIACLVAGDRKERHEFMLKTYNLRTAYKQSKYNEILPKQFAQNKSKFVCRKHGPWLLIVFIARLMYMALFTLSFFFLAFESINAKWFDVLSNYDAFADNRDAELGIVSSSIDAYYHNETEKMAHEIEWRQKHCYTEYINKTNIEWNKGALSQYNNHSQQMNECAQRVDIGQLNQSDTIYITGSTACDILQENGAHVIESDPIRKVFVFANGTYKNTTYWRAQDYDRNWDNFTQIEELLIDRCMQQSWCDGWTWIDAVNTSSVAHYYLLSSLSNDINSDEDGLCYTVSRFDSNSFSFGSIEALQNRTDILRDTYLNDYAHHIETMSDSLNGIWNALQSFGDNDEDEDAATYTVIIDNDPSAQGYDIDVQLNEMVFSTSSQGATSWTSSWYVIVQCPGCPDGNFTSPYLEEIKDYVFGLNNSNITDYMNGSSGALPVNISNLVSINPALMEFPNVPSIDFPIAFNIGMDWSMIIAIGGALDILLLIYRWYRTIGILARIIRGKDVEIALRYLSVKKEDKKCCDGSKCSDKLLSSIMWIHDKFHYLRYNLVKLCYWMTMIMQLFVVAAVILMLYIIADQVLTVDFIHDLGTFNLMTTGIAAQRAVRNQVLSTTALSYNNYTINNIQQTSTDYANTKNMESYEWNIKELKRVDEWNAYFCSAYTSYQLSNKFIDIVYNSSSIQGKDVVIDIELPCIQYTDEDSSFWDISQIQMKWNYTQYSTASINIKSKLESTQDWMHRYTGTIALDSINMNLNETRFIRIIFSNSSESDLYLNQLKIYIYGSAPRNKIVCDKVQFHLWSFDASDVKVAECPAITPVFGNMYRGFVRSWMNQQLLDAHEPFILAVRNIALSPFFLLLAAICTLIVVYLLAFLVEWLLIRFDLFRENVYSKVTLINTKWEDYDADLHYVTTPESSDDDDDDDDDECGGNYMSPNINDRKKKYMVTSSKSQHNKRNVQRRRVISPRFIEMEQIVLTSAKKVKEKFKRLRQRKQLLSPNQASDARELAQMLFNENSSNHDHTTHIESDSEERMEAHHSNDDHVHDDRCKQQ